MYGRLPPSLSGVRVCPSPSESPGARPDQGCDPNGRTLVESGRGWTPVVSRPYLGSRKEPEEVRGRVSWIVRTQRLPDTSETS